MTLPLGTTFRGVLSGVKVLFTIATVLSSDQEIFLCDVNSPDHQRNFQRTVKLRERNASDQETEKAIFERLKQSTGNGDNIIKYYGSGSTSINRKKLSFVSMEPVMENLDSMIKRTCGKFSEKVVKLAGLNLINGIHRLHVMGHLHCNISPASIFVDYDLVRENPLTIKIGGFGRSVRFVDGNNRHLEQWTKRSIRSEETFGTFPLCIPSEHDGRQRMSRKSDIFSIIVLLFFLRFNYFPWGSPGQKGYRKQWEKLEKTKLTACLGKSCPPFLLSLAAQYDNLEYKTCPNYGFMKEILSGGRLV